MNCNRLEDSYSNFRTKFGAVAAMGQETVTSKATNFLGLFEKLRDRLPERGFQFGPVRYYTSALHGLRE